MYLKGNYRLHVQNQESLCRTHCRTFALSNPKVKETKSSCQHDHSETCDDCQNVFFSLQSIHDLIDENVQDAVMKEELLYEAKVATSYILEWMKHIIRRVHTQETKVNVLSNLDEESAWVVGDWMMKIPPQQYREKMKDWFGKRDISGHAHCFLMPNSEGLKKATYFTFLDRYIRSQDIFTTACVIENDFLQYKKDFPDFRNIHCRNDNASCYAGASAVMVKQEIAEKLGLKLTAVDFNEAQKGKDQCDRDGSVAKRAIRS